MIKGGALLERLHSSKERSYPERVVLFMLPTCHRAQFFALSLMFAGCFEDPGAVVGEEESTVAIGTTLTEASGSTSLQSNASSTSGSSESGSTTASIADADASTDASGSTAADSTSGTSSASGTTGDETTDGTTASTGDDDSGGTTVAEDSTESGGVEGMSSTTADDPSEMVEVPAGAFSMGSTELDNEQPVRTVMLDTYWIDRTEVTVAGYQACVETGCCTPPTAGERCNYGVAGRSGHPITCVSWDQARQYCECQGKSLPTEAQWEKAARGPGGLDYPWGQVPPPDCDHAVMDDEGFGCGANSTAPVGSRSPLGDSPYGLQDMAGNAWEWVADYEGAYDPSAVENPTGPATGSRRVLRGASWTHTDPGRFRTTYRNFTNPVLAFDDFGMRCASSTPP